MPTRTRGLDCWLAAPLVLVFGGCTSTRPVTVNPVVPPPLTCPAAKLRTQKTRPTVAIPEFMRGDMPEEPDYTKLRPGAERLLAEHLEQKLIETGRFRLVDRRRIGRLMEELRYQSSDLVDPANRRKFGKQLAADFLLLGTVTRCVVRSRRIGPERIQVQVAEIAYTLTLDDVQTGEAVWKMVHSGDGLRLIDSPAEFDVDPVREVVIENERGDQAVIRDIDRLAHVLLGESMDCLRGCCSK